MSLYLDASAFVKLYVSERDSDECMDMVRADPAWIAGGHTFVEVRRALDRVLVGRTFEDAKLQFRADWERTSVVEVDAVTVELAADLAEVTKVRTLDALHLAAARRTGEPSLSFLTYDLRLAQAARSLGFHVLGA
ncbi:MAG: type II toxin-antitoxin system VapC family toxin [Chloroflexi bacterium]|nr:type II toxin-antitoxin system VapC family toxin [Chloroflexota bacterium]MBA3959676.1 type II toxin-antitoxin system VapC family toxin [Chloroflexota bacterium]